MKRIEIVYPSGPITVEAYMSGKFAVHGPDGQPVREWKKGNWYRISHVATGRAVVEVQGLKRAKEIARGIDALLPDFDIGPTDWEPEWSERYRTFVTEAKNIIQGAPR